MNVLVIKVGREGGEKGKRKEENACTFISHLQSDLVQSEN